MNETYFVCLKCGTVYRYLLEPVSESEDCTNCSLCTKHPYAPTCDNCGTAMLATNNEEAVILLRDAVRITQGKTA